jgi:nitrate/nitrite-specific signal transduction histidine kinase
LRIMRDSARVIGADFNLASSAAQGTLIRLTIPQARII